MGLDPLTIAVSAMAVGSVLEAGGAVQQGNQQRQLAEQQAAQLDMQAAQERDAAVATAERIRRAGRRQQAESDAAFAASGVSVGVGTPVRVNEQIGLDAETDAYMEILSGTRRSRTLQTEAKATRRAGRNAQEAGYMAAGTSILKSAANFGMWRYGSGTPSGITASSNYTGGGTALNGVGGTWG